MVKKSTHQQHYRENIEVTEREKLNRVAVTEIKVSDVQDDMIDLIKSKIRLLPPVTSKVFNLYAIDGYKHNEIANLLKISEGTSQWHYSIAKKRIREMISEPKEEIEQNERAS